MVKRVVTLFLLLFSFASFLAVGQMTVSNTAPYNSPTYLVQNVLVGQGVTISNVSVTGQSSQVGYFDGTNSNIGLDEGIVLSSGDIFDIPSGGNQPTTGTFGAPGDNDLVTVAQSVTSNPSAGSINSTNDVAILEFDFVPSGDTVRFNFVFASEEYTTYINTVYNDAFGFFVSGPGYAGPYASPIAFPNGAENLAVVPGTTDPITISTIHPGLNSQYYLDNPNGHDFNGFTTPITIEFAVQCNQTYHFKFAVADCQDDYLDTGVFLEAESFESNSLDISLSTGVTSLDADSTIIEGCTEAIFTFARADTTDTLVIHYTSSGSAIEGLDFDSIPDSLVFLPGMDSISLVISPIADTLNELQDTIRLSVMKITPCGDTVYVVGVVYIMEDYQVRVNSDSSIIGCPGDSIAIVAVGENGIPEFQYSWDGGGSDDTLWVTPLVDTYYKVTVTDSCALSVAVDSFLVQVPVSIISVTPDYDSLFCPGFNITIEMGVTGGTSPYSFNWDNGQTNQFMIENPMSTSEYLVTVMDQCGQIVQTSDTIYVIYTPLVDSALIYTSQCPGDAHTLLSYVEGGVSNYSYAWSSGQTTNSISVNPNSTTVYVVTVTDQCNQTIVASDTIFVPIYDPLQAITLQSGEVICPGDGRRFTVDAEDGSMFGYVYQWSHDALETDSFTIVNITQDTTVFATITDGCGESTTATFYGVLPVYNDVSVVVTPESFLICEGDTVESTGIVSGGAGIYTYEWIGNNVLGAYDEISASLHPSDELGFNLIATDQCGNDDTTTVYIEFDDCSVVAPAVFSPNGDAYNQYLHFLNLEKWPNNHLLVYNRWGTKVYDNNYENDWDGDNQPDGVYYYILTLSDREEPMTGYFHITR